ncbi:hypothetical protein J437_LFUL004750 [Ladona fulva]|uniref:Delta-sarcoglycan n=1 Tax=Ladona fulva TaxID=123851 RepID=A0A8K0P210_LADFU|nr:hypothetical protein J437_LFUL004750 [Ladona fulva]
MEVLAKQFRVSDPRGKVLFSADGSEVMVGADILRVTGTGGAIFGGAIQTPLIRADSGNDLRLESPTRSLKVRGPMGVAIESRAGDISASCLTDLKLQSLAGTIRLDSSSVILPRLKTAKILPMSGHRMSAIGGDIPKPRRGHEVFQLCVCGNGKLFLAPPEGICIAGNEVCR